MDHTIQNDNDIESDFATSSRMTVSDAACRIGVCEQTVRNLAHAGRLKWFWGNGTKRPSGIVSDSVKRFLSSSGNAGCRRPARSKKGMSRD